MRIIILLITLLSLFTSKGQSFYFKNLNGDSLFRQNSFLFKTRDNNFLLGYLNDDSFNDNSPVKGYNVLKIDTIGNIIWQKNLLSFHFLGISSVKDLIYETPQGNFYIVSKVPKLYLNANFYQSEEDSLSVINFYDRNLAFIWSKTIHDGNPVLDLMSRTGFKSFFSIGNDTYFRCILNRLVNNSSFVGRIDSLGNIDNVYFEQPQFVEDSVESRVIRSEIDELGFYNNLNFCLHYNSIHQKQNGDKAFHYLTGYDAFNSSNKIIKVHIDSLLYIGGALRISNNKTIVYGCRKHGPFAYCTDFDGNILWSKHYLTEPPLPFFLNDGFIHSEKLNPNKIALFTENSYVLVIDSAGNPISYHFANIFKKTNIHSNNKNAYTMPNGTVPAVFKTNFVEPNPCIANLPLNFPIYDITSTFSYTYTVNTTTGNITSYFENLNYQLINHIDQIVKESGCTPYAIGINEYVKNSELDVFPNPFNNFLNFESELTGDVCIYDIFGRIINMYRISNQKTINTESIPAGMYFIEVKNGHNRFTKKVIKQ